MKTDTENLSRSEKIRLGYSEIAKAIKQRLKKEFPNCKFSVSKETYSGGGSITVALMESDIKVIRDIEFIPSESRALEGRTMEDIARYQKKGHHQLNHYQLRQDFNLEEWCNGVFLTEEGHKVLQRAVEIADEYNYDDSDPMTDYFSVNYYLHMAIGKWDKDFKVVEKKPKIVVAPTPKGKSEITKTEVLEKVPTEVEPVDEVIKPINKSGFIKYNLYFMSINNGMYLNQKQYDKLEAYFKSK